VQPPLASAEGATLRAGLGEFWSFENNFGILKNHPIYYNKFSLPVSWKLALIITWS
jgi:hypothetical protein